MSSIVILRRTVNVITIPYGEKSKLYPGSEALLVQDVGGSFTLNVMGSLFYLFNKDADAIGRKPIQFPSDKVSLDFKDKINENLLWNQLKSIYDPEIPVNIVDLGLIYDMQYSVLSSGNYLIKIYMTLTAPGCGMGPVLINEVKYRLKLIANIEQVNVVLTFDPPWHANMMTDIAKIELGLL